MGTFVPERRLHDATIEENYRATWIASRKPFGDGGERGYPLPLRWHRRVTSDLEGAATAAAVWFSGSLGALFAVQFARKHEDWSRLIKTSLRLALSFSDIKRKAWPAEDKREGCTPCVWTWLGRCEDDQPKR